MCSAPPETVIVWSRRTTSHGGAATSVPLNSSTIADVPPPPPPPPPPPLDEPESGSNRIQSNIAVGFAGAWSLSATGPMPGFENVLNGAGRPTLVHVSPSNEYWPVMFVPSEWMRTKYASGAFTGSGSLWSAASLRGVPAAS